MKSLDNTAKHPVKSTNSRSTFSSWGSLLWAITIVSIWTISGASCRAQVVADSMRIKWSAPVTWVDGLPFDPAAAARYTFYVKSAGVSEWPAEPSYVSTLKGASNDLWVTHGLKDGIYDICGTVWANRADPSFPQESAKSESSTFTVGVIHLPAIIALPPQAVRVRF